MENVKKNQTKDILLEVFAVFFLCSSGIFIRRSSMGPINTGLWRMIVSLPFLFVMSYKDLKSVNKKDLLLVLLSGIFLAGDLTFFNMAVVRTSIANSNLLCNLTAFVIVPVSYFVFKEKIPKFYLVGLIITIIGVVILVTGKKDATPSSYQGDFLAVCGCVSYALFLLTTYKLRERLSASVILFIGAFSTIFVLFFTGSIVEGFQVPNGFSDWINIVLFALSLQVIGQNLLAYCQGKISVNLSSAITLLQPVIAAIYSFILFGEKISVKEMIGIAIVITGVYICKKQYQNK